MEQVVNKLPALVTKNGVSRPRRLARVKPEESSYEETQQSGGALTSGELNLLDRYTPHTLADLPKESLMNRVDKKFIVPRSLLSELLIHMSDGYTVLELDDKRVFRYFNTYYDNDAYGLYLDHHNGKSNRYKIRHRTYVDSDTSFLEVKFKNNKKRTLKTRMLLTTDEKDLDVSKADFLSENGLSVDSMYKPSQTGSYMRIALANEAKNERITIDVNLIFNDINKKRSYALGPWIVVEVKQSRQNRESRFFKWAQRHGIRKSKFSKYCMGVYFTGPTTLKRNNFHRIAKQLRLRPISRKVSGQHRPVGVVVEIYLL